LAALTLGGISIQQAKALPVLSVTPSTVAAQLNELVSLDIVVSGVGDYVIPSVGGFDIEVGFDPTVFTFQHATFGTGLNFGVLGSFADVFESTSSVELLEVSFESELDLDMLQPDTFKLFSLSFLANAVGVSPFKVNVLSITNGTGLEEIALAEVTSGTGRVFEQPPITVPEPSPLAIISIALFCTIKMRRKKLSSRSSSFTFGVLGRSSDRTRTYGVPMRLATIRGKV